MDESFDYLTRRLEQQRQWHSEKAAWNKYWVYRTESATLFGAAAIRIVNLLLVNHPSRAGVLKGLLGGVVVVAAAVGKLFRFHESRLLYRTVVQTLDREKEFYSNRAVDYADPNGSRRNQLLVERVENILGATTSEFVAAHRARDGSGATG